MKASWETSILPVRGIAFAALVTALSLLAPLAPEPAAAEDTLPGTISVSKSRYIEICQETGGNPIEQADGSVTCFYPDGSWSQCWFDTGTCIDSPAIRPHPNLGVPPPSRAISQTDPSPSVATSPNAELNSAFDGKDREHKARDSKSKKGKGKRHRR